MLFTNRDKFTSSFLICMSCISFSYLITLAKTSSIVLNRSGKSGCPHLMPGLEEKLSIFYHYISGLFIYGLYCVEIKLFYASFFEKFYHERMLNFAICFFSSIEMILCCFTLLVS